MLLTGQSIEGATENEKLEGPTHIVYWQGFVYSDGAQSGVDSIARFLQNVSQGERLAQAARRLKGLFFIAVKDKRSETTYVFTDAGGLFHAFYSESAVSTSFLELAAYHGILPTHLNADAIVEFLHFGYLSLGKTFVDRISRLNPLQMALLSRYSNKVSFLSGASEDIGSPPLCSFDSQIMSFANSVTSEKVSIDLTGGIDSRLLAVLLAYFGLTFEAAVRGGEEEDDVVIAREIAEVLKIPLYVLHHDASDFELTTPELFRASDGLFDLCKAHSPLQMQKARRSRGVTLMVTGAGGELFKDFWWLQDFPFYGCKRPNLQKLYRYRIVSSEPCHEYLSDPYRTVSKNYHRRQLDALSRYAVKRNTHTYDKIYYIKMRDVAGRLASNHMSVVHSYAPYLEIHNARVGYHLPPSRRFFNIFHRVVTTHYNPAVARVRTTEGGISVSSEYRMIVSDIAKYTADKVRRAAMKIDRRFFRRVAAARTFDSHALDSIARRMTATRAAFEELKSRGILACDLKFEELSNAYLGTILAMGTLMHFLEDSKARRAMKCAS